MTSTEALSIGAMSGGSGANGKWVAAVMALMRLVRELRVGVTSPLGVNVVFQIPGDNLTPEFEGVRSGIFSRKESKLLVQVGLPSEPRGSADQEVRCLLRSAVLLAEDFAQQEALVDGELEELRELLERL